MRTRPFVVLAALAAVALAASACSGTAPTPDSSPNDSGPAPATLSIIWPTAAPTPNEQVGAYAVAVEMGYFAEENLTTTVNNADGSTAAIQAVASGSADVTATSALSLVPAVAQGVPIKAFGGLVQNWPYQIAVAPESPVKSVKDLEGKKIGIISLASASNGYTRAALTLAGLDPDADAELIPVGAGASAGAALMSGEVDVLALYGAAYGNLEAAGLELRYLDNDPFFSDLFSLTFATTPDNLDNKSDVMTRFGRAMYKGTLFTAANPEAAMRMGYKVFPTLLSSGSVEENIEKDTATLKTWLVSAVPLTGGPEDWSDWGQITPERWDSFQNFMMEYTDNLDAKVSIDKLWDGSLVEGMNDFDSQKVIDQAKAQ